MESETSDGVPDIAPSMIDEDLLYEWQPGVELDGSIPWCDTPESELTAGMQWVDYSDRGPRDVVLSGPVTAGWGPGRWHKNRRIAYWVATQRYGAERVKPTRQTEGRWSFLIKNLRSA